MVNGVPRTSSGGSLSLLTGNGLKLSASVADLSGSRRAPPSGLQRGGIEAGTRKALASVPSEVQIRPLAGLGGREREGGRPSNWVSRLSRGAST